MVFIRKSKNITFMSCHLILMACFLKKRSFFASTVDLQIDLLLRNRNRSNIRIGVISIALIPLYM